MLRIDELNQKVKDIQSEVNIALAKKDEYESKLKLAEEKLNDATEAIGILVAVLSLTQEGVNQFIRDIVGMALQYVYGDEYDFEMRYEMKRNQPEVVLTPIKSGKRYDPKFGCGVGVLDVCAFALRLALWALTEPRTSAVLICDEPFKFISGSEQVEKAAIMVKELSDMLGLQIIIISSKPALTWYADKIFDVKMSNGESVVTEREMKDAN